ncbi:uncharacterized protein M421DRAFT_421105 [Didymella exigua CBS 183.55]|uniref:EamA domain-containing protein n=1 Tax=Didymella exigua CBS 183.55 TaxID=1150837 RepID=A0A6A5RNJ6_9PLEO|nr:uncharacterized protein M421DRAFT_421105 [Didymella exigua CBS 183.55]KAF1927906.1 hypothetical protein M421DRAFT_421105 [Didymella exigua CBS 183.55]
MSPPTKSAWLFFAITSGACAAFNGVFAKLTTTELTSSWSASLASAFGLDPRSAFFEYALRAVFFGMNLLFNAVMWGLFTRALTLASSTVRVSVINTSANFMITAVMSALIFSESLPGLWWLGAAMLVAGSVIVGMREEGVKDKVAGTGDSDGDGPLLNAQGEANEFRDEDDVGSRHELDSVRRRSSSSERSDDDGTLR